MRLNDFAVLDFSGGVRRDKPDTLKKSNELADAKNVLFDEYGRVIKRRGSVQYCETASNGLYIGSYLVYSLGTTPFFGLIAHIEDSTDNALYTVTTTYLTANVATSDTTINVSDQSNFSASGTVEIDGDLIAYTGKGSGTLTGCTGITSTHTTGAAVNQLKAQTLSSLNGRSGVYFSIINNVVFCNGLGKASFNGNATVTAINDADGPSGAFATNYKDRIYVAGSNGTDASGFRNGSPTRVSFSDLGDGTSWDINNFFDVESKNGAYITGLREYKENLLIFKIGETFAYNIASLNQLSSSVGAYNHYVVQEVNGLLYTFCPSGVYEGNGSSWRRISDPIKEYIDQFIPSYDTVNRTITNCSAGTIDNQYWLYIGNVTSPETRTGVVLVYDTEKQNWTTFDGFANVLNFTTSNTIRYGNNTPQGVDMMFWSDNAGKIFKMFGTKYYNTALAASYGKDVYENAVSDTGTAINASFETQLYDLDSPGEIKNFGGIRLLTESGMWNVEYRVEDEKGISQYKPLGRNDSTNSRLPLPKDAKGYRIGFRFSNTSLTPAIFNGFILEDINTGRTK